MQLKSLFDGLAASLDGRADIEARGREALCNAAVPQHLSVPCSDLPDSVLSVMSAPDAHPVCRLIAETSLPWAAPQTSTDAAYIADSLLKVHVELIGPGGLVASDHVRLGLYGMLPNADYGVRTHPAEEIFVMLAGEALWKRGDTPYLPHKTGERVHHPSMLPHATRTATLAFMSIYIWRGDISTERYAYQGRVND